MDIKEEIHSLSEEMLTNLGRLVAIDSQLGTPAEGKPFGEGPAKALEEGLMVLTAKDKVRLLPPLTITYDEIDQGVEILKKALS